MKKAEVASMFRYLRQFYPDMAERAQNKEIIAAWQTLVCCIKKDDAWKIIQDYIKENRVSPTVSDLIIPWRKGNYEKSKDMAGE